MYEKLKPNIADTSESIISSFPAESINDGWIPLPFLIIVLETRNRH